MNRLSSFFQWVVGILFVLVLFGTLSYIGSCEYRYHMHQNELEERYEEGYRDGYEQAMSEHEYALDEHYSDGYYEGYRDGYEEGYEERN